MKKKYLAPVAIALIATISITTASCGKPADEEVNATEAEVTTTVESTEEIAETTAAETEATVTAETKAETTEAEPETKAEPKRETEAETKAAPKAEAPKAETKAAPKAEAPKAPAPTQAAPAPTEPVHEHVWKEHTATRDEWVPNVVTVTETKKVPVRSDVHCNCGAVFIDGAGAEDHAFAHIMAGEPDNYHDEVVYEERTETHEEDQGYYQTIEYVDYYYCECGATK